MKRFVTCSVLCFAISAAANDDSSLETAVSHLYERTALAQTPVSAEEVPQSSADALALIVQADAANRPDLMAKAYQSLFYLNVRGPGVLSTVVDRALIDLAPRPGTSGGASEQAINVLGLAGPDDRPRVIAALTNLAAMDMRGEVVGTALRTLGHFGGSDDHRIYDRLILNPTPENSVLFADSGGAMDQNRQVGIRAEAMLARLNAGKLPTDIDVYPTLNELGRKAAAFSLTQYVCELQAPDPALADQQVVAKCVTLVAEQFGPADASPDDDHADFVRGMGMGLYCLTLQVSARHCSASVLDAIEQYLNPLRQAIITQPNGAADPRVEIIDYVLQSVATARAALSSPPSNP